MLLAEPARDSYCEPISMWLISIVPHDESCCSKDSHIRNPSRDSGQRGGSRRLHDCGDEKIICDQPIMLHALTKPRLDLL